MLTADLVIFASATFALVLNYIPEPLAYDFLGLAANYGVYLQLLCIVAIFGIAGGIKVSLLLRHSHLVYCILIALQQSPTLLHGFASFLTVDAFFSIIPKALLAASLLPSPSASCAASTATDVISPATVMDFPPQHTTPVIDHLVASVLVALSNAWQSRVASWAPCECRTVVALTYSTLFTGFMLIMVFQLIAALAIRRYARRLGKQQWRSSELGTVSRPVAVFAQPAKDGDVRLAEKDKGDRDEMKALLVTVDEEESQATFDEEKQ